MTTVFDVLSEAESKILKIASADLLFADGKIMSWLKLVVFIIGISILLILLRHLIGQGFPEWYIFAIVGIFLIVQPFLVAPSVLAKSDYLDLSKSYDLIGELRHQENRHRAYIGKLFMVPGVLWGLVFLLSWSHGLDAAPLHGTVFCYISEGSFAIEIIIASSVMVLFTGSIILYHSIWVRRTYAYALFVAKKNLTCSCYHNNCGNQRK